jgi:hypothetical protein
MWQTYTPDGRLLLLRRTDDGWHATCLARSVQAATAEAAIRGAIDAGAPSDDPELEQWIADHVAELDSAPS